MNLSPQFLESVNAFLLVEFIVILWLFFRYILQGFYVYGWREGRRRRAAAMGVFTLIAGDLIIRASVWWWRHAANNGRSLGKEAEAVITIGTTVGVVVVAVGAACIIREFSPTRWGEWPWILTIVVAATWSIWVAH